MGETWQCGTCEAICRGHDCPVCGYVPQKNRVITQSELMEALEERVEALEKRLSLLDWKA